MQPEFTHELLKQAGEHNLHRAMETTGYGAEDVFVKIAGELDFLFMDVKFWDEEKHIRSTGVSNQRILSNIKAVRERYPDLPICLRTPVIPGFNDTEEEIRPIAALSRELHTEYELLKYHRFGIGKYESLNREYELGTEELDQKRFEQLKSIAGTFA